MLKQNYPYLDGRQGVYVIRNKADRVENRFKIGIGMNMTNRLNNYYTYFPDGIELYFACALELQTKEFMLQHEKAFWQFVIEAADGKIQFQFNPGRTGTEWIIIHGTKDHARKVLMQAITVFTQDLRDQQLYGSSNRDNEINKVLEGKRIEAIEPQKEKMFSKKKYQTDLALMKAYAFDHDTMDDIDEVPLSEPIGRVREWVGMKDKALRAVARKKKKKVKKKAARRRRKDEGYVPPGDYAREGAQPHRLSELARYKKNPRRNKPRGKELYGKDYAKIAEYGKNRPEDIIGL